MPLLQLDMALVMIPLEEVGSHTLPHQDEPHGNRTHSFHRTLYSPEGPTDIGTGNVGSIGGKLTVSDGSNMAFVHLLEAEKHKDDARRKKEGRGGK